MIWDSCGWVLLLVMADSVWSEAPFSTSLPSLHPSLIPYSRYLYLPLFTGDAVLLDQPEAPKISHVALHTLCTAVVIYSGSLGWYVGVLLASLSLRSIASRAGSCSLYFDFYLLPVLRKLASSGWTAMETVAMSDLLLRDYQEAKRS